eukprot:TRINITY_DN11879_c0_g1_i3.p1 TRINITY_DN11879_c0_g1~~TRINITY_DN11879_c0_g1_i3.p1  ORF type:complete len:176 (-),score=7.74 TRINITY_DN11879_c0_g1_i3:79-606(-)
MPQHQNIAAARRAGFSGYTEIRSAIDDYSLRPQLEDDLTDEFRDVLTAYESHHDLRRRRRPAEGDSQDDTTASQRVQPPAFGVDPWEWASSANEVRAGWSGWEPPPAAGLPCASKYCPARAALGSRFCADHACSKSKCTGQAISSRVGLCRSCAEFCICAYTECCLIPRSGRHFA